MRFQDIIDTRPGQSTPFSAPEGTPDYTAWLRERYHAQQYKDSGRTCLYGAAQQIHAMLQRPAHYAQKLIAVGPYAGSAAQFIEDLARKDYNREIVVEVIPW